MGRQIWVVGLFLLLVSACGARDEADVIRNMIRESAGMAEAKQVGALMRQTGRGFVALPGRRNADEVKPILFAAFMHYGRFEIQYPRPEVHIAPEGRQAQSTVYFIILRKDQPLPGLRKLYENPRKWLAMAGEKADLYQLKLELEKKEKQWVVMQAHLEGFKGLHF